MHDDPFDNDGNDPFVDTRAVDYVCREHGVYDVGPNDSTLCPVCRHPMQPVPEVAA